MSTLICNNPFSIPVIDLDECIGLSLIKINNSFKDLADENCLTFDQLNIIQNDLNDLYSSYATLSSFNNQNRYAKAWVNFNGKTTTPTICSTFNVAKVNRYNTGIYGLSFINVPSLTSTINSTTSGYCLIATSLTGIAATTHTTPFTSTSADINIRMPDGRLVDSEYVSIAIYSL